ncbi:solute carrier family 15 member 2-like [Glandiceps talaboti]
MGKKGQADFSNQADLPMEPMYSNTQPTSEEKKTPFEDEGEYDPNASCLERYPKSTYFIIGMEFCERYCYYGMKAILILYFTEILLMSNDSATSLYHTFVMLCYLSPIGGAMISDGFWGKYKTIFLIAWVYLAGCVVMSLSSIPQLTNDQPRMGGPIVGLFLIAMGTGGIKPCVAAFGGDQFRKEQMAEIQTYFLMYYFAINCGSLLSTFLTPILREDVQCFDNDCYPLAYGVPAMLLLVAIVIFVVGRYTVGYKIYPGEGNVVWMVCKAVGRACKNKWKYRKNDEVKAKYTHWMDYADDKYDKRLINDTKCLLHVLIMYIPVPVYWALFDQQGSRWTLQATQMDGYFGNVTIKPDQMQVLNPLFIICLIPIFDNCIYPLLKKCGIKCTYLQRMCWGMVFAAVAFYIAAVVQIAVADTVRMPPCSQNNGETGITVINASPCDLTISNLDNEVQDVKYLEFGDYLLINPSTYKVKVEPNTDTSEKTVCTSLEAFEIDITPEDCKAYRLIIGAFPKNGNNDKDYLQATLVPDKYEKPDRGMVFTSFVLTKPDTRPAIQVNMTSDKYSYSVWANQMNETKDSGTVTEFRVSMFENFEPGEYTVTVAGEEWHDKFFLDNGAAYSIVWQDDLEDVMIATDHMTVPANTVNIFWQIPQYFVITCGEVMFSITGLEFSYAQAPASMKSSLQACWLLTIAVGNLIVIIQSLVAPARSMAIDFFLFGTLMLVVFFIFVAMSVWYEYIDPHHYDDGEEEEDEKKQLPNGDGAEGVTNPVDTTKGEN